MIRIFIAEKNQTSDMKRILFTVYSMMKAKRTTVFSRQLHITTEYTKTLSLGRVVDAYEECSGDQEGRGGSDSQQEESHPARHTQVAHRRW